uniref:Uncharacterized protein n=1 Tax=uncultured bacterium A1Q1_fos_1000 TaxID=1256536 RepID=L7VVA8_9BACT|nr:hypothetical protein [uncultured bacterium A1Q1_fos_1000]
MGSLLPRRKGRALGRSQSSTDEIDSTPLQKPSRLLPAGTPIDHMIP